LGCNKQPFGFHDSGEFFDLQNDSIPVKTDLYPGVGYYQNNEYVNLVIFLRHFAGFHTAPSGLKTSQYFEIILYLCL